MSETFPAVVGAGSLNDLQTHVERINGTEVSPSYAPGSGVPHPLGEAPFVSDAPRQPHRLTAAAFIGGVYCSRNDVVMLQPHEVGPHTVALPPEQPTALPEPVLSLGDDHMTIEGTAE